MSVVTKNTLKKKARLNSIRFDQNTAMISETMVLVHMNDIHLSSTKKAWKETVQ